MEEKKKKKDQAIKLGHRCKVRLTLGSLDLDHHHRQIGGEIKSVVIQLNPVGQPIPISANEG